MINGNLFLCGLVKTALRRLCGRKFLLLVGMGWLALMAGGASLSVSAASAEPNISYVPSSSVGNLAGEFSVNGNGSAVHAFAITVPPGTNGLAPNLSLTYDSHRGNGYLGMGWALNGLSAITRCGANYRTDGYKAGVDYSARDRFCLDGRQLIAASGTYGGDGAVYHTEQETWTLLTSHGNCGRGPCYFSATDKDGNTLSFGATTGQGGSRILAAGRTDGAVRTWAIDRFADLNGNATSVSYFADADSGEYYPTSIDYTHNDAQSLSAQRSVRFAYAQRPDPVRRYLGGSQIALTKRMTGISTHVTVGGQDQTILAYKFAYEQSGWTKRSRLTSVTMCDAADICFPPTGFSWQTETGSFQPSTSQLPGPTYVILDSRLYAFGVLMDFNGDGIADYSKATEFLTGGTPTQELKVYLGKTDGSFADAGYSLPGPLYQVTAQNVVRTGILQDINGDGILDFSKALRNEDSGQSDFTVYLGSAQGFTAQPNYQLPGQLFWQINGQTLDSGILQDLNGDGLPDYSRATLLAATGEQILEIYKGTGTGFESTGTSLPGPVYTISGTTALETGLIRDINGDGIADFSPATVNADNGQSDLKVYLGQTPDFTYRYAFDLPGQMLWQVNGQILDSGVLIDINGDGIVDYSRATRLESTGEQLLDLYLGTGNGFIDAGYDLPGPTYSILNNVSYTQGLLTNWNQDGTTRYSRATEWVGSGNSDLTVYLGSGTGFTDSGYELPKAMFRVLDTGTYANAVYQDINGDGLTDFVDSVCVMQANGVLTNCSLGVSLASGPFSDLLSTITNGFDGATQITYAPLTSDIYTAATDIEYPLREAAGAYIAVSGYTNSDGRGNSYAYGMSYAGALSDVIGYGWIGFGSVAKIQQADGRKSVANYDQTYPYYGLVTSSETRNANGDLLIGTAFQYVDVAPQNLQDLKIHQPLRSRETITHYTNNSAVYSLEKAYEYDSYGNITITSDLGDPATTDDDFYNCVRYLNDTGAGRYGYPLQDKVTRTKQSCQSFVGAADASAVVWDPTTDLRWSKTEYDANMNALRKFVYDDTHSDFLTTTYSYDAFGNTLSATSPAGNTTSFNYDTIYHTFLTRTTTPTLQRNGTGYQMTSRTSFEPGFGMLVETVDANGVQKSQDIDGFGRPVTVYGPNPQGTRTALTTTVWGETSGAYYLETRQRPGWDVGDTSNWYWERDFVDGLGRDYKQQKYGVKTGGPAAVETQIVFDDVGRTYQKSAPYYNGDPVPFTTMLYDDYNRPTDVTSPAGVTEKIDYDQGGLKISRTAAFGTADAQTVISYMTPRGRTYQTVDPNGLTTTFSYDPLGQLLSAATSPDARSSSYSYDSLGRHLTAATTDSGETSWAYDANGLLATITDAAGYEVAYSGYDALNRLTEQVLTAGSNVTTINYAYDNPSIPNGLGNQSEITISQPTLSTANYTYLSYSAYGQVTAGNTDLAGEVYHYGSEYDPVGRVTLATYPNGAAISSSYLTADNIGTVSYQPSQGEALQEYVHYSDYTALGKPENTELSIPSITIAESFFPVGPSYPLLKTATVTGVQSAVLGAHSYQWNKLNALTAVTDTKISANSETYGYDNQPLNADMGFLTQAEGPYGTRAYTYDQIGNMTGKAGVSYNYAANSDRLTATSDGESFTYLDNGNVSQRSASDGTAKFAYDAVGQLLKIDFTPSTGAAQSAAYAYDHAGRLMYEKRLGAAGGTYWVSQFFEVTDLGNGSFQHTAYVPGAFGPIAAITGTGRGNSWSPTADARMPANRRAALDSSGTGGGSGEEPLLASLGWVGALFAGLAFLAIYFSKGHAERRPRLFAAITPFVAASFLLHSTVPAFATLTPGANGAGIPTPGTVFFVPNRLNSTVLVTDEAGRTTASVAYLPYGAIDQAHSSGTDNFRPKFLSQEWDAQSGMYRLGARFYDPALGRFLTPDPARQYKSPYIYSGNNPVTYVDPSGEFAFIAAIVIGAVVGAYFGGAALNHDYNPLHWNWSSGKTYAGLLAGGAIGSVGAAAGGLAVEAGVAVGAAGGLAAEAAGVAIGIAGQAAVGAGENAAFTALGGGSSKEILESAGQGALFGAVFEAGGQAVGAAASRFARGEGQIAEEEALGARRQLAENSGEESSEICQLSFPANVPILLGDGRSVPISEVEVGDQVLARDLRASEKSVFQVTETFSRMTTDFVELTFESGERLAVTPTHPFRLYKRGWVEAKDLGEGSLIHAAGERAVRVTGARPITRDEPVPVHNFEVAGAHNYFAGKEELLVHNGNGGAQKKQRVCTASIDSATGVVTETWNRSELKRRYPKTSDRQALERDIRAKHRNANKFMKQHGIKAETRAPKKVRTRSKEWVRWKWKQKGLPGSPPKSIRAALKIIRSHPFNQDVDEYLTRVQGGLTVFEGYPDNQGPLNSFVNQTSGAAMGALSRSGPSQPITRFQAKFVTKL